jgi:hypothetical protein
MFESFTRTHYIGNVYNACAAWLKANADMEGTAVYLQMVDIKDAAEKEYNAREATEAARRNTAWWANKEKGIVL